MVFYVVDGRVVVFLGIAHLGHEISRLRGGFDFVQGFGHLKENIGIGTTALIQHTRGFFEKIGLGFVVGKFLFVQRYQLGARGVGFEQGVHTGHRFHHLGIFFLGGRLIDFEQLNPSFVGIQNIVFGGFGGFERFNHGAKVKKRNGVVANFFFVGHGGAKQRYLFVQGIGHIGLHIATLLTGAVRGLAIVLNTLVPKLHQLGNVLLLFGLVGGFGNFLFEDYITANVGVFGGAGAVAQHFFPCGIGIHIRFLFVKLLIDGEIFDTLDTVFGRGTILLSRQRHRHQGSRG